MTLSPLVASTTVVVPLSEMKVMAGIITKTPLRVAVIARVCTPVSAVPSIKRYGADRLSQNA